MTLQQIIIFLTVSEEQGFTKAAEKLYISQPTVSREISLLEQELKCSLFTRGVRTLTLTDAGKRLLPEAKRIESICAAMPGIVRGSSVPVSGILRIGYIHNGQPALLMKRLGNFLDEHPDVELETLYDAPLDAAENYRHKKTDILLTVRAGLPQKHGPVFVLERSALCIMALKGDPLFGRESVTLPELADRLIVTTDPVQMPDVCRSYFDICGRAGFVPRICATGKKVADMKLQAQRHKAIVFIGKECMYMSGDDVRVIPVEGEFPETDSIAVLQRKPFSDVVDSFANALQQGCAGLNRPEMKDGI